MALEISLMSFDVARNVIDSNQLWFSYKVLNESNTILNCLNNANFDTKKLKLTDKLALTKPNFEQYQKHMKESAEYMQTAIVDYVKTSLVLEDTFKYYQGKVYNTYYFYNNNDPPIQQSFQYNDALFEYITTIIAFSSYRYQALNNPDITNSTILGNFYFIETNGMSTIFFDTIMNQINIFAFFKDRFTYYLKSRELLLGLRVMSILIIICLILPIIGKLSRVNDRLLGIYRLIPISDIMIIEEGSMLFIANNFEDSNMAKKEVDSEQEQDRIEKNRKCEEMNWSRPQSRKSSQHSNPNNTFLPLLSSHFANPLLPSSRQSSPCSTFRPLETSDALLFPLQCSDQKQSLKRRSLTLSSDISPVRKIPKVKLSQIPSNKNQILFFIAIILIFLGYCVGQYYIHFYFFSPLETDHDAFTYYKTALSTNRQTLLNAQQYFSGGGDVAISNFNRSYGLLYWNLESLYDIVQDTNRNRQIIYGSIQQLKTLFSSPYVSTMNSSKFLQIQKNIDFVEINLINESNNFMSLTQNKIKGQFQKICYIKFVLEFVVLIVIVRILFAGYLEKVRMKTYRSIAMARMIPVKIVMGNQEIVEIMSK